jgi:polyferredoxin
MILKISKIHWFLIALASIACIGFGLGFISKDIALALLLSSVFFAIVFQAFSKFYNSSASAANENIWFESISNKGFLGKILAVLLTAFYVVIYWFPALLGYDSKQNTGFVAMFDGLSYALNGHAASQWFVYGTLYTLLIIGFGIRFLLKYKHNRYQQVRTLSLMFFQLFFAFLIPEILSKLNPELEYFAKDIKNMWPLNYYLFEDWHLSAMLNGKTLGYFFLVWGLLLIFVVSPILTYFYGKRWYCSWVCGCGGLAETAGDSFRHLSDKSTLAWKIERYLINGVLLFVILTTISVVYAFLLDHKVLLSPNAFLSICIALVTVFGVYIWFFTKEKLAEDAKKSIGIVSILIVLCLVFSLITQNRSVFFVDGNSLKSWYGFYIGAAFSGVIGVGFYPIFGSRVWCRFGCPMAAILGLQQKLFSRFRITTNGSQCISCGNCSTSCEMGIDVRAYAQKGEDIVRSSCVGCGICSEVCPRGVLKLENGKIGLDF